MRKSGLFYEYEKGEGLTFYTKRFAFFVGRRCRASTLQDVANKLHLN